MAVLVAAAAVRIEEARNRRRKFVLVRRGDVWGADGERD